MKTYLDAANELGDCLGDEHNLDVLRQTVMGSEDRWGRLKDVEVFVALLDRRRQQLREKSLPMARKLLAEPKKAMAKRLEAYWDVKKGQ